jgi:hypothetical protein
MQIAALMLAAGAIQQRIENVWQIKTPMTEHLRYKSNFVVNIIN